MTNKDAAMRYISMGLAVFAVHPRTKEPATTHGVHDCTLDPEEVAWLWGERPDMSIGVACGPASGGLVVIDVDVDDDKGEDGMATLRAWENAHGELPETATAMTGRGGCHLYYYTDRAVRCSVNQAAGVDVRAEGGYVLAPPSVHPNGRRYEWELDPSETPIAVADDNVLAFLASVQHGEQAGTWRRFELPARIRKGERDDTLFKYASSLRQGRGGAAGMDEADIRAELERVNGLLCDEPLPRRDIERLARQAARYERGKAEERPKPQRGRAKFDHAKVAAELAERFDACRVDGSLAVRRADGRTYSTDPLDVERAVIAVAPGCTDANRAEVVKYLALTVEDRPSNAGELVAFEDAVVDARTGEEVDMPPDATVTNVVPHRWNPDARAPEADAFLAELADGDPATELNLAEVVGLAFYRRSTKYGVAPVLLGEGGCGKSTYLGLLRHVVGARNTSMLELQQIGVQFQTSALEGKMLNIGDDVPVKFTKADQLSVFKKAVTGEPIRGEVKYRNPYDFTPHALIVLSANQMPRLEDATSGMMRRLFPIEFTRRFAEDGDADFDKLDALTRDEAVAERMCVIGVQALARVVEQGGMTANPRGERLLREIEQENDSVAAWLAETPDGYLAGKRRGELYADYRAWSRDVGRNAVSELEFGKRLCRAARGRFVHTRIGQDEGRFFRPDA